MTGDAPAIRTRGLTKRFGSVTALEGLDLTVPRGVVFGLLGPNGAGKTTTIRLLTGLARPTAGSAEIAGIAVASGNGLDIRRRIGVLDQDPRFYGWMTGRELMALAAELGGLRGPGLAGRVADALEQVGLADAADRRVGGYSGGMRQRLGIGQAIVGAPEVLILDEPVSSLDPEGRRDLLALMGELRATCTVVFSTHVLSDVERICDRIAILDRGRLVTDGPIDDLLARYALPIYRLEPDPGQDAALSVLLTALEGARWASGVEVGPAAVRVSVADEAAAARELLAAVVAAGLQLAAFERERPTLEDVFLRLVGRDREDAA